MKTRNAPEPDLERAILAWLAAEAAVGNRTALEQLLKRLQRPLTAFLARSINHAEEVRDAWQETALAISGGIGGLKDTAMVRAWAFQIARNKVMDAHRQRARAPSVAFRETQHTPTETSTDRTLAVQQVLRRLPEEEQSLIFSFYHLGLSLQEIALALGISPGAARVRLFRTRAHLKSMLEGETP